MVKAAKKGGRIRDKWRDKQWIIVNAPAAFGGEALNHIPITDVTQATGRVIENTMYDVMKQDPSQHQIKIFVQINRINDGIASTVFKGHEYAKEYLRSLIRRGSSMISYTHDYTTMDGHTFRVATVAFSQRRVNTSRKHELRLITHHVLSERIPKMTVDQFAQEVTMGKLGSDVLTEAKKITAIRHLGIKKTKLISTPESRAVDEAKPVEAAAPAA